MEVTAPDLARLFPSAESRRLAALHATGLLDTAPEDAYDRVTGLAALLLGVPVALVTLVEPHRQFFKAAVGLTGPPAEDRGTPASHSICKHVVASGEPVVLPDVRTDAAFCDHPAVLDLGVGAYLGVPLRAPSGEVLGALCVIDHEPHPWTQGDVEILARLSAVLTDAVEKGLTARRLDEERRGHEEERRRHEATRSLTGYYLDALDDVFFVADGAGHLVRWNRAVEKVTREAPEALLGQPALSFFAEGDRDRVAEAVAETLSCGRGRVEATLLTPLGFRPYEFTTVRLPGGGAFCGIGRDVSARHAAERAVRESEERFRLLAEAATDVILTVDESMTVRYVNGAARAVLGYDPSELVGGPLGALMPERFRAGHEAGVGSYLESGERRLDWRRVEVVGRRKDGAEVPLAVSFGEYRSGGGRYFTAIMRDETAQREAERALLASERRFRSFVEATSEIVYRADPDGYVHAIGDAWTAFTGQTPEAAGGWGWAAAVHPDDAPALTAGWAEHLEAQRPYAPEYRVRRHDGVYHRVRATAVPVFDNDGVLLEWVGTVTDVDEARRLERERAETVDRLRLALEAADMGTWEYDTQTGTVVWSDVTRRHFGVGPDAPVSKGLFYDQVVEEDRVRVRGATAAVAEGRVLGLDEVYRVRRTDGSVRWFRSTGRAFHDALGAPARVVGTVLDVTDQKEYEGGLVAAKEAAEAARRAAEAATRLKASVLANMSHEVRTPLTGVIGYADLLAEMATGEEAALAEAIQRGAHRLLHTLNSVLELSQLEGSGHRLEVGPVDVREAVVEAAALLMPQARASRLALTVGVPEAPVTARADPRALSRVVSNLVSNAVKYTEEGAVAVAVEALSEGGAEVRVSDTGIGMAPSFLPHLFEEFRQESEGDDRRYEGAGLGLAIVKRLVDAMGGEVLVESKKGRGSTFTVRLLSSEGPG